MKTLPAALLFILLVLTPLHLPAQSSAETQAQRVQSTARILAGTYDKETGLFRGTGWWNSANGITALANASRTLHSTEFDSIFQNTFAQAQKKNPGFLNEFYDDEGWWALAWLDVYQLHGGRQYLQASQSIFQDMTTGWSDTCNGGIWWKKNERYKNAIANELFLSVAVRLAQNTKGKIRLHYLDWAQKEAQWFENSGMINEQSLVNDGLDSSCHNNGKTTWTYNQGVILTGLSGLNILSKPAKSSVPSNPSNTSSSLALANRIATAVNQHLTDVNGVLHDPCEPNCGADGIQFKGILVRNLAALAQANSATSTNAASPSQQIATLLHANAESLWTKARTSDGKFSTNWAGPATDSGTGSLISALDALTAPLLLSPTSAK